MDLTCSPHLKRAGAASGLVSSGECCDETLLINMICGVVSGVISSTLANPTDVLKIRMQAQGSLFQGGMIGSFIDIYQQEGTRGLWRGVVPTAQRAAIVVGVELPVYDITKKHLILSGFMGDTILAHFVSSFTCGLAGAIASNPVDVVRTRMMNQRAIVGSVELYKGTLDGLVKQKAPTMEHSSQGMSCSATNMDLRSCPRACSCEMGLWELRERLSEQGQPKILFIDSKARRDHCVL
ncbi:brain mitochondrial carrier protein 1 isoform X4 [Trachemys scripta elegans]|uniref:brain mitochondrial carrier protein 1 isoform X4 n=1 Tax=Trachemys scripta elegans TaxID=31138 RepID=UPI0015546360|nr:brain mitochondrial carrier protein 1 isoform X4 [Trachemys scripta elegans]